VSEKPTELELLRRDNDLLKERCAGLEKHAALMQEQRDEWQAAHRFLVDNGYAWVGDVDLLLDPSELLEDEDTIDALQRVVGEWRTLRAATPASDPPGSSERGR
jgi:hypothetical protein